MGQGKADVDRKASAIQRLRASLGAAARKNVSRASKILMYATVVGAISRLASSDPAVIAALPDSVAGLVNGLNGILQASPFLSGLVGMIGGDLMASVVERVSENGDLSGEEIADLIEEMLANSEARGALHKAAKDILENEAFRGELQQIVRMGVEDSGLLKTRTFVETASRADERATERHEELLGLVRQMLALMPASFTRPIPMQKPRRAENFTGREEEVAQCVTGLAPGQAVTLVGAGGMGKSAIAAEVLWELAAENEPPANFPDGIVFHSFYGRPQADVALEHLAASFGVVEVGEPQDVARRALAGRKAVVVLDGAEEADDLRSVLEVCGSCGVLVTTRRQRQAAGEVVEVAPLPRRESVILMRKWAGPLADDEAAVERVCELLGNLPLAVRLVGRYLREQNEDAGSYVDWLEETPLKALDQGKRRERSVPLLLMRSLEQVGPVAREVAGITGILALAPFRREVVGAALELSENEMRSAIAELVDYGLLAREGHVYRVVHRLIHTYAHQRLPVSVARGVRLAEYYAALARESDESDGEGYGQLEAEWRHIMYVFLALTEAEVWPSVLELAWAIKDYASKRVHAFDQLIIAGNALAAADELNDRVSVAAFCGSHGNVYLALGNIEAAITWYRRAASFFRGIDRGQEGVWTGNIGNAEYFSGNITKAIQHHKAALAIAREVDDKRREGAWLASLAADYHALESYDLAIQYNEDALDLAKETEDRRVELSAVGNLGVIYGDLGEIEKSIDFYREALVVSVEIGDRRSEGVWLGNLGSAYAEQGKVEEAIELFKDAVAIARQMGDRRNEASSLGNLGIAFSELEQMERAIEYHEQALSLSRTIGDRTQEAAELVGLGIAYRGLGDTGRAGECWKLALAIYEEIDSPHGETVRRRLEGLDREGD